MRNGRHPLGFFGLGLGLALGACGGGGSADKNQPTGKPTAPTDPPPPLAGGGACRLSVDCPPGTYCDLGECRQDCNTALACPSSSDVCGPRARCLPPGTTDGDPAPTTDKAGTLSVLAAPAVVGPRDNALTLTLRSDSPSVPVRYRLVPSGPHLSVPAPRGEFRGETTMTLPVDASKVSGREAAGSVRIVTTLGDAVVNAPLVRTWSGAYAGALRYEGAGDLVPLGPARFALDLDEDGGKVRVRVRAGESLLFPASAGEVGAEGALSDDKQRIEVTLAQRIAKSVGDDRNAFGRDLGRVLHLALTAGEGGSFSGTFDETVHGLFDEPVTLRGSVVLAPARGGGEPERLSVAPAPSMPSYVPGPLLDAQTVYAVALGTTNCANTALLKGSFYALLPQAMGAMLAASPGDGPPFEPVAEGCRRAATLPSASAYLTERPACSFTPALACGLASLALSNEAPDSIAGRPKALAFHDLLQKTLAAPLLVAKDALVRAPARGIAGGLLGERGTYEEALDALHPSARFVLQPAVLSYARRTPASVAAAAPADADPEGTEGLPYPGARALADLLQTMSVVDGERSRLLFAEPGLSDAARRDRAQARALVGYLESVALAEILRAWGSTGELAGIGLAGALAPLDEGFGRLVEGSGAFGVPDGFVPFVYRAEDAAKAPTNFEQMAALAAPLVEAANEAEAALVGNDRQYEANAYQLHQVLLTTNAQYDEQLAALCGDAFAHDAPGGPEWARCGEGGGAVAEAQAAVDTAVQRVVAAQARAEGQRQKIVIDQTALAKKRGVRADTIRFIKQSGDELEAMAWADAVIRAQQAVLQGVSGAVVSAGASVAAGAVTGLLELQRGALDARRADLQTAQTVRFERQAQELDQIEGQAAIQKAMIDLAQLQLEMQTDVLAAVEAARRRADLVAQARRAHDERARALALHAKDPALDPSFRLVRDQAAATFLAARARAQEALYLAGQALAYELNTPLDVGPAVLRATSGQALSARLTCFATIFNEGRLAFGAPQDYATTVSVRAMLGVRGPRADEATGATLSEGEQFRLLLLKNENVDGRGGVEAVFATDLGPDNALWATDVCGDRISAVQAQLVGDFLGDNQAVVQVGLEGAATLRACDQAGELRTWSFGGEAGAPTGRRASVQAGVNSFGDAPPNASLFGQAVARATWRVRIPGGTDVPANRDLDLTKLEDIVLKVNHKALPRQDRTPSLDASCLTD
ncbi:MAG TPA: hypothetical protein VFS43_04805 [Polyangiaceae bacterium]|nr:hypothetical protein [Polyangiaceae bacterium]